ncbi:MAG: family 20 glycosylhydrolase [Ferruginibacter sp.]
MKKIIFCLALFSCVKSIAQNKPSLVPMPAAYKAGSGSFSLTGQTVIVARTTEEKATAALFNEYLQSRSLRPLSIVAASKARAIIFSIKKSLPEEGYRLSSSANTVMLTGNDAAGLFYGMQTLIQLFPLPGENAAQKNYPLSIPQLSINDYPRFRYRGMHLDVARHFASVDFVKRYIDYLSYHKFNNFHWHLTDDQGWRIEIKKYPLLTSIGGCRAQTLVGRYGSDVYDGKKYCGSYTQEEIREVVRYAATRHINVIPEIEMPGHALAALSAYPYLGCTKGPYKAAETWGVFDDVFCAGNDSTFTFMENVLDEVLALFPSKLIHIGGDECPKVRWKECPACQARIKKEKLKDEHGLQSYFIHRIEKYLNSKGRNIIGWDEILEGGLAPNATVMSWRGEEGGIQAAKEKHNVIMTPTGWMYFDYSQSSNEDSVIIGGYVPLDKVYNYEPIPAALDSSLAKYVLGAQANVWREYMNNDKKTEYMIFPRMSALSEVLWTPKSKRSWEDFERRLPSIFARYKSWGANYSTAYYDLQSKVIPLPGNGIGWKLNSKNASGKIVYTQNSRQDTYGNPISITQSTDLSSALFDASGQPLGKSVQQSFSVNKASGKPVTLANEPSKAYAGSGGFTLVDAVQNTRGMNKSAEFLGFSGKDLDAVVDLGQSQNINGITLHAFEQSGSWIYRPRFVVFYASDDGRNYSMVDSVINLENKKNLLYSSNKPVKARFIKVIAKNAGIIEQGNPGAGEKAWMFVDEIEVL